MSETTDGVYGAVAIEAYPTRTLSPVPSQASGARGTYSPSAPSATAAMTKRYCAARWRNILEITSARNIPIGMRANYYIIRGCEYAQ